MSNTEIAPEQTPGDLFDGASAFDALLESNDIIIEDSAEAEQPEEIEELSNEEETEQFIEDSDEEQTYDEDETEEDLEEEYEEENPRIEEYEERIKELEASELRQEDYTRKTQELAAERKVVAEQQTELAKQAVLLKTQVQKDLEAYNKQDWKSLANTLDAKQYNAHKENFEDLKRQDREAGQFLEALSAKTAADNKAMHLQQAKETTAKLKESIPGWSRKTYNDVKDYAVKNNLATRDEVNNVAHFGTLMSLYKSMQYDNSKAGVKAKTSPKNRAVRKSQRTAGKATQSRQNVKSTPKNVNASGEYNANYGAQAFASMLNK